MMVLTLNDLEVMAEELKQCRGGPDSNPKGLDKSCRLKEHQLFAVDWMLKKEDQLTHGGILADDMGLGKTLELIALILKDKEMSSRSEIGDENDREEEEENPTLIVCPLSLMKQWYREISKFVQSKKLSFCEFYGPTNKISPADQESLTKHHDVVITNYQTLSVSPEGQTLFDIKWKRVILDEAHFIKNPDSEVSRAVCKLKAKHKWCVTGTPISNNLLDLYSLYKFLKLSDFDDKEVWENDFGSGTDLNNQILLHDLLRATMIRRSKVELGGQLCLPEKTETIIEIVLDDEEKVLYQRILELVEDLVKERTAGQTRNRSGFGAILLKRQALAHPYLLAPNENVTINQTDVDDSPNINVDEESVPDEKLNKWWDGTKVDFVRILKQSVNSTIFRRDREPSKLRMLHKHLDLVLEQNDKAVIVSQWVNVIDLIKDSLEKRKISHQCITGAVKVKDRMKFCEEFNDPDSNCKVLLLQMQVGGCGLNLTGGNHLFVYDIHWNPQLLKQVYDRIYRIGQTKPVFIKMLITKTDDSIEEFILETQKKKLELAEKVLSFNKMTPNDGWCLTQQVVEEITKLTSKEYGALVGVSKE